MSDFAIVPPNTIPLGLSVSIDNPVELYSKFLILEDICIREKGVGLSAVQIGWPENIFVAKINSCFQYFINCSYKSLDQKIIESTEGCLSLRDSKGNLRVFTLFRFDSIQVDGYILKFKESLVIEKLKKTYQGYDAIVLQHEIDHQNGILISQIGTEIMVY